jgi:hypothetical protein
MLVGFLEDLLEDIQNLQQAVVDLSLAQIEFNTALSLHTHEVVSAITRELPCLILSLSYLKASRQTLQLLKIQP